MSSDISVRDQIFSTYDSLYDAEKKVADYLINHPTEAIEMSVSELASRCEASQATIVRFCQKNWMYWLSPVKDKNGRGTKTGRNPDDFQ